MRNRSGVRWDAGCRPEVTAGEGGEGGKEEGRGWSSYIYSISLPLSQGPLPLSQSQAAWTAGSSAIGSWQLLDGVAGCS